ncbi:rhodanese-like domain-containing protein [Microlunatus antarcticus]|uniref:Rhodanese-related sulfurtransferase n=1 Tax=Microlunatus antarcticus TaxID=53388 RepID=A0A7W5JYX9_9ACTN|nr:rhodanese-like domain-containing protein [Microlunatus antarcticus]MBB3328874.1 rhodanese-related sulfurtransferase [Microlunatus antarcticus]
MITYEIVQVAPQRAQELIEAGWFVLDIRPDEDWAQGHIAGSTHMAVAEVVSGVGTRLPEPTLVVSTAGRGRIAQYLRNQGVEVSNLEGGFFAWEAAGLPVER